MKRKLYLAFVAICLMNISVLYGQQVVSSAGASAEGTGVQLSWTIGEPLIETFTGSSAILTQGFHQSKLTVTPIDVIPAPDLDLAVYPNPVSTALHLQATGKKTVQNLKYALYNIEGKMILVKPFVNSPEEINMELYRSGTYFLKVMRNDNIPLRTFKVIKD